MSFKNIQIQGSPSINNTVDTGYYTNEAGELHFYDTQSRWRTLDTCNLDSSNISQIDSSGGLVIKEPGIYRLSLSVDISGVDRENNDFNLYFSFATSYIDDTMDRIFTSINSNLIGYTESRDNTESRDKLTNIGIHNKDNDIGIISWQVSGINQGRQTANAEGASFVVLQADGDNPYNPSVIRYFGSTNTNYSVRPGILTTELVFQNYTVDKTLYLAIECTHPITFGKCYFVIQLISTNTFS